MLKYLSNILLAAALAAGSPAFADKPETLQTGTDSAFYMSDAAYYPASGDVAVVFVPGFIFNKESWKKLATRLQKDGVASVAISAKSENPIRRAIQELTRRGHKNVVLVGGSSGAAAILNTMEQVVATDTVSGVVLMSPVRGNPMDDHKTIMAIPGKAHAQFLFFGPDKEMVSDAIVEFVKAR